MAIQIKLKNSVVQDSTPSASDLPVVGELALNANINSIGGFMRASDNSIVKIFGPGSVTTPTATTTVSGIAELATSSETTTGTATNRVVTPAGLNAVTVAERTTSNTNYVAKAGSTLTGVLTMPNGSNSAPAINFGDSDSGIFGGTNSVSLTAGGTTGLSLNSSGFVNVPTRLGVGVASPDVSFEVSGGADAIGRITGTTTAARLDLKTNSHHRFIQVLESDGGLRFYNQTSATEMLRVDSSGRLLVGHSSNFAISGSNPRFQLIGGSDSTAHGYIGIFSANNVGANFSLVKSRNGTVGSQGLVQDDDVVGNINFVASDGNDAAHSAARISAAIDGTAAANDLPGRLVFSTTIDGASSPAERLRIANNGNIFVNKGNATGNATIILDKSETGAAKLEFDKIGSQKAYIELDAAEDLVQYGVAGVNHIFYSGTERMRLDDSGRLGVGTTDPSTRLVVSNGGAEGLEVNPLLGTVELSAYNRSTSAYSPLDIKGGHFKVLTGASSSTGLFQDSSGNVGIGTTSPTYPTELTVSDTTAYSASATNSTQHQLRINNAGLGGVAGILLTAEPSSGSAGHAGIRVISPSSGNANMTFSVRDGGTYSEKLRIQSDGNVGIGTTSPQARLHLDMGAGGLPKIRLQHSSSGNDVFEITGGLAGVSNGGFGIYDVDETAYRLAITSSGNVGIGTTSPTSLLNVHGIFETNAFDSSSGSGGRFTTKGFLIGDAYTAGKTSSDDRNAILWNERGLDIDVATNDTIRMKVHSGGGLIVGAVMTKDTGTYYDDITINNSNTASGAAGGAGLSLVSGDSSFGGIIFSRSASHGRGYMKYDQTNDRLILGTQTNDRIMIEDAGNNGDVHIKTGNIVLDTASRGINFHNFSSGTGITSNLLDDYEEGTHNPTIVNLDVPANVTTNHFNYTKVGRLVHINAKFTVSNSINDGSGFGFSLPFAQAGSRENVFTAISDRSGTNTAPFAFIVNANQNNAYAKELDGFGTSQITYNSFSGNIILVTGTYEAS